MQATDCDAHTVIRAQHSARLNPRSQALGDGNPGDRFGAGLQNLSSPFVHFSVTILPLPHYVVIQGQRTAYTFPPRVRPYSCLHESAHDT